MKEVNLKLKENEIQDKGKMPMLYTIEEIEEVYNSFFSGLCLELIPLKNKDTINTCIDLKRGLKCYRQEEVITNVYLENETEHDYKLEVDFITYFKPSTLVSYGVYVPCSEMVDDMVDDMLLPSPHLDSNEVIDKILRSLSNELGRVEYERDSEYSGVERFFQFIYDSSNIKLEGLVLGSNSDENLILFSFPLSD